MKLRTKIVIVFILSIVISIIVFIFATAFQLTFGGWSGISEYDMHNAVNGIAEDLAKSNAVDAGSIYQTIKKWSPSKGMEFEVLSKDLAIVYSTNGLKGAHTFSELAQRLSHHGVFKQKEWVVIKPVTRDGEDKYYVLASVQSKFYLPITMAFNIRGAGILGKIFLVGVGITMAVSTMFAILFTIRISRRFSRLSKGINTFELGNMDVAIPDKSKDEIGKLAASFNGMAVKLKDQVQKEKEFQEQRRQLVSNISHDLRTPLTSIVGYSESLNNGVYEGENEQKKYINIIWKSSLYMEKLLDELLEFSRMEAPNFELNLKEDDLAELSREILIEYIPHIEEKGMQLEVEIPDHPVMLKLDRDRISRVLRNLLENALKYGAQGKYLGLLLKESDSHVDIHIKDKGVGIDEQNLSRIFERFYRADKARNSKAGGMGLGLAIAQEIVKKHGGRILAESIKDEVTTFIVRLPR